MMVHMDITGYVEHLRADLAAAAATGGEAMVDAAERLATSLDAAVRLALLEALSDAAAEITAGLDGATVEVRLRGRDPDLVVTLDESPSRPFDPFGGRDAGPATAAARAEEELDADAATARITLRLPEALKARAEAAATSRRQSLNTWLVDAVRSAADGEPLEAPRAGRRGAKHLSGWAR
jgi:HicB-like protein involved in pilus formation